MKNIFYGLGAKFKNRKARMGILTVMYALLFTVVVLLMALSYSLESQIKFIDRYVKKEVSVTLAAGGMVSADAFDKLGMLECVEEYNGLYSGRTVGLKDAEVVSKFQYDELYRSAREGEAPRVTFVESNRTDNNLFFLYKGFKLIRGRHLLEEDRGGPSALISEEFAKVNGLEVGDFFETVNPMEDAVDGWLGKAADLRLKVAGIFSHPQVDYKASQGDLLNYEGNFVFITDLTIKHISNMNTRGYEFVSLYLKEGRTIEDLRRQMEEARLSEADYFFSSTSEWAAALEDPLLQMRLMCRILSGFVLICILVSVLLLGAFHIRQSLHELGMMLGMGVPGWKLLLQVLLEEYVPLFCGAALALLVGGCSLGGISQAVDRVYTEGNHQIMEQRNEELHNGRAVPALRDFTMQGQVMQMRGDFGVEYVVDWGVFLWFAVAVCMLFPCCMGIQIFYKIRHCMVKQILLE